MKRVYGKSFPFAFLLLGAFMFAGFARGADSGLSLMKVETGSRAAGMGGAFVSISGDPFSAVYNPAGAHGFTSFVAAFEHNELWANTRLESWHFAAPIKPRIAIFGGVKYAALSQIEVRGTVPSAEPDALADAHDVSFKTGFSYRISDKFYAGFGFGWMLEKIVSWRGSSFNVDLGAHALVTPNLRIGASISNLGSDITLRSKNQVDSRPIPLPLTYRIGASYDRSGFIGASDIVVLDDKTHLHLGAEKRIHRLLSARVGYAFNYDSKGLSAGASFIRRNLSIDYAFVPYSNELNNSHQFTFTFAL